MRGIIRACSIQLCLLLAALIWFPAAEAAGDRPVCSVCSKRIHGRYLTSKGKPFCSSACHARTLPRCTVCSRTVSGAYLTAEGKTYCSDRCFDSQLPTCEVCRKPLRLGVSIDGHRYCRDHAQSPRCWGCQLPFGRGAQLADGRTLCQACNDRAIMDRGKAQAVLVRARDLVRRITGWRSASLPRLQLVGLTDMPGGGRAKTPEDLIQRGLYRRTETTITTTRFFGFQRSSRTEVKERVLILRGLQPDEFLSTAAHELTHDLMAEFLPRIDEGAPKWVTEGICQFVAAAVCRHDGLPQELHRIETSEHPTYGDGYRYFAKRFGPGGWPQLVAWARSTDIGRLPATAP